MTAASTVSNRVAWASPLREVELAAQAKAKSESLDMSSPGAIERLRAIVAEEVEEWRTEYRRGRRPVDIADPDGAVERAMRNLAGYGPLEPLLADADVWEVMVETRGIGLWGITAGQRQSLGVR